ncbi:MAG: hypothetical protein ACRYG6_07465, partial [Janthinobacterium lividum]
MRATWAAGRGGARPGRVRGRGAWLSGASGPVRLLPCYTPAMRILFLTATRIGDAVLSTGLLDHLIRT